MRQAVMSATGPRTQSVGGSYNKEKDTHTSPAKYGRFSFDDAGSLDVYVVKSAQDFLNPEGLGGTHRGYGILCVCTTFSNMLEIKSVGWMMKER